MDFDFRTYYKSLTPSHRDVEEFIVSKAIEHGVISESMRFGLTGESYRGVIKSCDDKLFYFTMPKSSGIIKLVKADTPDKVLECSNMFKACNLGCSLIKGDSSGQGQGQGSGGFNTIPEEAVVQDQDDLTTEQHPGSATHVTPDSPHRGRMWHEQEVPPMTKSWDASALLTGLNESLQKSTSQLRQPISDQERQFMVEVLGRTPEQVQRGDIYMNPTQKVMYNQWLSKSMRSSMDDLTRWLKK